MFENFDQLASQSAVLAGKGLIRRESSIGAEFEVRGGNHGHSNGSQCVNWMVAEEVRGSAKEL